MNNARCLRGIYEHVLIDFKWPTRPHTQKFLLAVCQIDNQMAIRIFLSDVFQVTIEKAVFVEQGARENFQRASCSDVVEYDVIVRLLIQFSKQTVTHKKVLRHKKHVEREMMNISIKHHKVLLSAFLKCKPIITHL